jgi:hypothetical protein
MQSRLVALIALIALLALACAGILGIEEGQLAAGVGGIAGMGGSGGVGQSAGGAGGGESDPCGNLWALRDDFTGIDAKWIVSGMVTVDTDSIALHGESGGGESSMGTRAGYKVRDGGLVFEIPLVQNVDNGDAALHLSTPGGASSGFEFGGGNIVVVTPGGDLTSETYVPSEHRFLRILEADGTIHFDRSPTGDDDTWVPMAEAQTDELFSDGYAFISLWARGGIDNTILEVGGINVGQNDDPGLCRASTLRDSFADGMRGPLWGRPIYEGACEAEETEGGVLVSAPGGNPGLAFCHYKSTLAYRLTDSEITVRVSGAEVEGANGTGYASLRLWHDDTNWLALGITRNQVGLRLKFEQVGTPNFATAQDYDPTQHAFWRISATNNTVTAETSPTGADGSWNSVTTQDVTLSTDDLDVSFGVEFAAGLDAVAKFDQLNVPQP